VTARPHLLIRHDTETGELAAEELAHLRKRMEQLVRAAAEGGTLPRSKRSIAASNRRR
jgi:hypothetical protein